MARGACCWFRWRPARSLRSRGLSTAAPLALFVLAALSLLLAAHPGGELAGNLANQGAYRRGASFALRMILLIGLFAAACVASLLWNGRNRELLASARLPRSPLAFRPGEKVRARKGRMPAQVIGAIGLTSTAAGAYYVATGRSRPHGDRLVAGQLALCRQSDPLRAAAHSLGRAMRYSRGEKQKDGIPFSDRSR